MKRTNQVDVQHALGKLEVFNQVSRKDLESLTDKSFQKSLKKGEFICHQGDVWPNALFVLRGELSWAMLSITGREQVLFTIRESEDFWGHSLFDNNPMPASLQAIDHTEVFVWPEEVLLPILYENPKAMWAITRKLVGIMRQAREVIYGLAFQPLTSRLAQLLLTRFGEEAQSPVERDLTLDQIAAMVNSTPEVVCRLMYQFQENGILEITRASIALHDRKSLAKLANEG
ncbi:MAG: Crp/Fnr family transcriptional regulator [Chloroflexi bacterium]|nr:MAG: Crp/Fnr family transcriptional regulator [Chloroflexota bacterium]MBL1194992.1 Crp/Fnr family transcriptional regulator [Chloroflexota bacterium]NOH12280.1 Crp/Fnr family transcriptional regulator [Chloroflexota bacterium]